MVCIVSTFRSTREPSVQVPGVHYICFCPTCTQNSVRVHHFLSFILFHPHHHVISFVAFGQQHQKEGKVFCFCSFLFFFHLQLWLVECILICLILIKNLITNGIIPFLFSYLLIQFIPLPTRGWSFSTASRQETAYPPIKKINFTCSSLFLNLSEI